MYCESSNPHCFTDNVVVQAILNYILHIYISPKDSGRDSFRESHGGEALAKVLLESVDDDLTDTTLEALNTVLQDG